MLLVDKRWSLFLDRDGVINKEKVGGYILSWREFVFEEGGVEALRILAGLFGRIIIVTNQRGVGKGYMSQRDLDEIHYYMRAIIEREGGRIDAIYACTEVSEESPCRKPQIGMALWAKRDFPEIDFRRSVMVGNSERDMLFGRALGMHTVWIASTAPSPTPIDLSDEIFPSLWQWALSLRQRNA